SRRGVDKPGAVENTATETESQSHENPRAEHLPQISGTSRLEADDRAPGRFRRAFCPSRARGSGRDPGPAPRKGQEDLARHDLPDAGAPRRLRIRRPGPDLRDRLPLRAAWRGGAPGPP